MLTIALPRLLGCHHEGRSWHYPTVLFVENSVINMFIPGVEITVVIVAIQVVYHLLIENKSILI